MDEITIAFVGAGGDGAVAAGDIIATACAREGLHVMKTEAYGPQIRGGESSCTVRIGSRRLYAPADRIDVLVVFSWAEFARFQNEVTPADDAVILHDETDAPPAELAGRNFIPVPFARGAKEESAPKAKNILALGLVAALTGVPTGQLRAAIAQRFGRKAEAIVEASMRAFERGLTEGAAHRDGAGKLLTYAPSEPKLLISGNDAASVATIDSGCRFFAGYPITPSSEILQFLSEWLPKLGGTALQTEDELSAIGAVLGASFAGQKALTATSGPGLSLMSEMLGLASIAEIPAVIVNIQRGGPSTGLPTKSEQSDLFHSVFGGHGDTPRVVIAPTDVEDAYHATCDAFNVAEESQMPVIVLSDQSIGQRRETIEASSLVHERRERRLPTEAELVDYSRYLDTADGISPIAAPGIMGGVYQTNGLEHDEKGAPNSAYVVHQKMNAKRYRKHSLAGRGIVTHHRIGAKKAELGILCWGSTLGAVREAVSRLGTDASRAAIFAPRLLSPFPVDATQQFIDDCEKLLVVELSYAAQFLQYLRTQVDLPRTKTEVFARSGGMTFGAAELLAEIQRILVPADVSIAAVAEMEEVTA